jgi:fructose-1,6-bisphosphatase/sedoheptulose 1,7-bisphosphatase-like protein
VSALATAPPQLDRNLALELVRVTEATSSLSMRSLSGAVREINARHHATRSNLIAA